MFNECCHIVTAWWSLSPRAGVSTADKTVFSHGANIILKDRESKWGRERAPSGCLACQIPQLHNSVRAAWAPVQPAFSTTMGGEAQERPVTPGERRNSLNPGAVIVQRIVALRKPSVILASQNALQQWFSPVMDFGYSCFLRVVTLADYQEWKML